MKMYVLDSLSGNIPAISAFTAIVIVCLLFFYGLKQRKNLPPGPLSFPLIGSLPIIATRLYRTGDEPEQLFAKMAGEYGQVFTLNIGTHVVVVANGYKSIKEAFRNPQLNNRPRSRIYEETSMDEGVIVTSGKSWLHQRKLTSNTLRGFGIGKNIFEKQISAEAEILINAISINKDNLFNPKTLIMNCVSNIVCSVVFGKRFEHSDPKFAYLMKIMSTMFDKIGSGAVLLFFHILRYLLPQRYSDLKSIIIEFVAFVNNKAEEHKEVFEETECYDFIDVFLRELNLAQKENGERSEYINSKSLVATSVFLFQAGTETSTATLTWALLYMIKHTDIQAKVQAEIDTVVGRERMPQWDDRLLLPYTEAVLHEIQRIRTTVPLGVPHLAAENTKLSGYDVPKNAIIISNLWAVHNDPAVWPQPDQFKPERFLDESGQMRVPKEYMPFSTGRRICLGENLAKMEVFIFFTYIMHKFVIKSPPGNRSCSLKAVSGFICNPAPYEIVAESRE